MSALAVRTSEKEETFLPQTIRISSKRQITIPSRLFKEKGFSKYAWIEETDEGILIKPVEVKDEDVSLYVLRQLVESGYEGEELLAKYEEVYPEVLDFHNKVQQSHQEIQDGKCEEAHVVHEHIRKKYGL